MEYGNSNKFEKLAETLVNSVHHHLGRYRADEKDPQRCLTWLSGLPEDIGAGHPTQAGLRIGKVLPERASQEPYDERLEWERDGQYFHYLTKWMLALDQVARYKKDLLTNHQAIELSSIAAKSFIHDDEFGNHRMYWKMSTGTFTSFVSYHAPDN